MTPGTCGQRLSSRNAQWGLIHCTAMTSSKKSNKRSNKTSRGKYENGINSLMIRARNPVVIRRFVLSIQGTITSSAGGILAGAFGMDPSGSAEWASLALIYDQFRVIGGQLKLACLTPNSVINGGLVRFAFDNDSSSTPASYADVMAYSEVIDVPAIFTNSIKTVNFRRPMIRGIPQEAQIWYNETSPGSSPGSLKFYGSGLSNSYSYYSYVLDYLVEFQMRS